MPARRNGLRAYANGRPVAVYNVDGTFYATDNTCIHRGGPLGEGTLTGELITCPWHGWRFDVKTGCLAVDENTKVATFEVTVEGDDVYVTL